MSYLLRYISVLLLLVLTACQGEGVTVDDEPISLTLKLATGAVTRGNVTDHPSDATSWSQSERVVDGRYLYTLSVYIVDAAKNIVASKEHIVVNDQASEVVVEFDKSSNLKRGVHTLMAVANYSDHTVGNTTLDSGIIGSWKAGNYTDLMNNKIAANSSFVSPKEVIQPLSLMKEFEIHAGGNFVEGELVRTIARLRIEVKNNSGSLPLKINNLSFSNNFAQQNAYVFDDGTDRKYFTPTGAIVATSEQALQPFVRDAGAAYMSIPKQMSAVVYDGYQLESKVIENGEFTYTLNLSYDGASTQGVVFKRASSTAISRTSALNDLLSDDAPYFLIYNTSSRTYLGADDSNVTVASISNFDALSARNVWQVTRSGNSYYFQNVETEAYMQAPTNNSATMGANRVSFTLANGITMYAGNRYLGVDGSTVRGYNRTNSNPVNFTFYEVSKSISSATETLNREITIPLTSINPVTQQSSKVTAIKRNDFINVLITVSYNPTSGEFDFHVEDWGTGGGQVEFN